jgi:hypothetical protein
VIAHLHRAHAAHARVLVGESAHEVVQQALAHRALGHPHPIDAEALDDLPEDREPAGNTGARSASTSGRSSSST